MHAERSAAKRQQSLENEYHHADSMAPKKNRQNDRQAICFLYASSVVATSLSIAVASMQTSEQLHHRSVTAEWGQPLFISGLYATSCVILISMTAFFEWHRLETFESVHRGRGPVPFSVKFSVKGEKVNLYLRLGLAMFGVMSVGHVAIRFVEDTQSSLHNRTAYVKSFLEMLFIILQTLFILRYHRLVILQYNEIMGAGLVHLLTTNLCIWADISVGKIDKTLSFGKNDVTTSENVSMRENATLLTQNGTESINWSDISFYLLPTVSEYCLLAAALLYEITVRIGQASFIEIEKNDSKQVRTKTSIPDFRRCSTNAGSWFGIIVVLVVIALTILTATSPKHKDRTKNFWKCVLILSEEVVLCLSGIAFVITAYCKTRKLKFSIATRQSHVEEFLLYTAFFFSTNYTVSTIILAANVEEIDRNSKRIRQLERYLLICRCTLNALELIQIMLQTYMIQDSFHRCSEKLKHQVIKPGRQSIVALLGINLAYWIQQSFQVKNADILFFVDNEKGSYGWILFVVTMPISLFYRYHCTVCLSQCFNKLYEDETQRFEEIWRYRVDPLTDMIIPDMGSFSIYKNLEENGLSASRRKESETSPALVKQKRPLLFKNKQWRTVDIPDELYPECECKLGKLSMQHSESQSFTASGSQQNINQVMTTTVHVQPTESSVISPPVFMVTDSQSDNINRQAKSVLANDFSNDSCTPLSNDIENVDLKQNNTREYLTISGAGWRRPSKMLQSQQKCDFSPCHRKSKSLTLTSICGQELEYFQRYNANPESVFKSPGSRKMSRPSSGKIMPPQPIRRRRTLKNLETAKYRVLAAELAHRMILERGQNLMGNGSMNNFGEITSNNLMHIDAAATVLSVAQNWSRSVSPLKSQPRAYHKSDILLAEAVNETAAVTIAPVESRLLNRLQVPMTSSSLRRKSPERIPRRSLFSPASASNLLLPQDSNQDSTEAHRISSGSINTLSLKVNNTRRGSSFKNIFRSYTPKLVSKSKHSPVHQFCETDSLTRSK